MITNGFSDKFDWCIQRGKGESENAESAPNNFINKILSRTVYLNIKWKCEEEEKNRHNYTRHESMEFPRAYKESPLYLFLFMCVSL